MNECLENKNTYNQNIPVVFLINLARSSQRLEKVSESLKCSGINYEIFVAIEGLQISITNLKNGNVIFGKDLKEQSMLLDRDTPYSINCTSEKENQNTIFYNGYPVNAGELGLLCSVHMIAEQALQKNNNIIIFEDDMTPKQPHLFKQQIINFITSLPETFDIGFLDFKLAKGNHFALIDNLNVRGVSDDFMSFGTHAWCISPKGMKKLLSLESYSKQIDVLLWSTERKIPGTEEKVVFENYVSSLDFIDISGDASTIERDWS